VRGEELRPREAEGRFGTARPCEAEGRGADGRADGREGAEERAEGREGAFARGGVCTEPPERKEGFCVRGLTKDRAEDPLRGFCCVEGRRRPGVVGRGLIWGERNDGLRSGRFVCGGLTVRGWRGVKTRGRSKVRVEGF